MWNENELLPIASVLDTTWSGWENIWEISGNCAGSKLCHLSSTDMNQGQQTWINVKVSTKLLWFCCYGRADIGSPGSNLIACNTDKYIAVFFSVAVGEC